MNRDKIKNYVIVLLFLIALGFAAFEGTQTWEKKQQEQRVQYVEAGKVLAFQELLAASEHCRVVSVNASGNVRRYVNAACLSDE